MHVTARQNLVAPLAQFAGSSSLMFFEQICDFRREKNLLEKVFSMHGQVFDQTGEVFFAPDEVGVTSI